MQNHIWGKTLLSAYRFLERIAGAIDKIIEKKALASSWATSFSSVANSTLELADQIIELSERKVKLINIKLLIEKALKKLDKKDAKILICKYFDKMGPEEIIASFGLSRRSYFRRIQDAESSFESSCASLGFPISRLQTYLDSEEWIKQIAATFQAKQAKEKKGSTLSI